MTIYQDYAQVYDGSGQVRFALLAHAYLGELLAIHPAPGRRMLDLACGTGTLALQMAGQGWLVLGVDASPAMLAIAEDRAAAAGPGAAFLRGDMRGLPSLLGPAQFDLVTCTYDSLNYLLEPADLAACFAGVAHVLGPGGLFVGDMNTRHFLEFEWGECQIQEQAGYIQLERSHFDRELGRSTMLLTGFVGDDERGYQRFDETHVEQAYPPEQVRAALEAAGLRVEACYDSFTLAAPGPTSQRIFWVARAAAEPATSIAAAPL